MPVNCDLLVEGLADLRLPVLVLLHDIGDLEGRQIPGVGIASSEFVESSKRCSPRHLAWTRKLVVCTHPIQWTVPMMSCATLG